MFCVQPIDKQSLLDSGIFCCLIHILNALLDPSDANQRKKAPDKEELSLGNKDYHGDVAQIRQLEVVFFAVPSILIANMCTSENFLISLKMWQFSELKVSSSYGYFRVKHLIS